MTDHPAANMTCPVCGKSVAFKDGVEQSHDSGCYGDMNVLARLSENENDEDRMDTTGPAEDWDQGVTNGG